MPLTPYEAEERIKTIENRLGKLELEIQNQVGDSLLKLHNMYGEQSDSLDTLVLLVGKLVQEVFPKGTPPDPVKFDV